MQNSEMCNRPSSEAALLQLRKWLEATKSGGGEIDLGTDLIREGVLDSIEMINFILFVEEIRGTEIPEALVRPQYFSSLRVIGSTFFE